MNYLQYFKAISVKISKYHEPNLGFDSCPQWSREVVRTYLSGWDCTYVDTESPPIMLSGCDWAPENLNLFNKS